MIDELVVEDSESNSEICYVPTLLSKDAILAQLEEIIGLTEDRPSSEKMKYLDVHTGFISYKMTGIFEYAFYHLSDDLKLLCDFKEAEGLQACDEILKKIEDLDSDDDDFVQSLISTVKSIKSLVEERKAQNSEND